MRPFKPFVRMKAQYYNSPFLKVVETLSNCQVFRTFKIAIKTSFCLAFQVFRESYYDQISMHCLIDLPQVSRNSNLENIFWEKDETPWRVAPLHFKLNSKFLARSSNE